MADLSQFDLPGDSPELPQALKGRVVDTHCHMDMVFADGGPEPSVAIEVAKSVGVDGIIQVGCDVEGSRRSVELAREFDHVWAAVALHPNEAPRIHSEGGLTLLEAAWREITELSRNPEVRAIGETGMDFYRTGPEGRAIQEESFRMHIRLAKAEGKTLVIHDRDSHDDVLRIMDDEGHPDTVVLHCFSGDSRFAAQAVERQWFCSFAGVITFKNAQPTRDAAAQVPPELLLVETDSPFLTPAPYRGRRNSSYLVPHTVRQLVDVLDMSESDLCEQLWSNSERAFGPM